MQRVPPVPLLIRLSAMCPKQTPAQACQNSRKLPFNVRVQPAKPAKLAQVGCSERLTSASSLVEADHELNRPAMQV